MRMNRSTLTATALTLTLAAAAACLSACGSRQRDRSANVDHDAWAAIGYRMAWEGYPEMGSGGSVEFFDLFDDVVVVQDTTSVVSVLEADSGVRRWSDKPARDLVKFVGNVRDGQNLYVSSESEVFIYDVQTSTLKDRQSITRVVNTRPVVAQDILVYGTAGGYVIGHQVSNGIAIWTNSFMNKASVEADPILIGELAGIVSQAGGIMFVDPLSGSSTGRAQIFGGTSVNTAASDDLMFIASTDHSLYAFAAADARQVWRVRTGAPLQHQPTYIEGRVFATLPASGLTALDSATGRELWNADGVEGTVIGLRNDNLMVWNARTHTMTLLDPRDGSLVNRVPLPGVQDVIVSELADGDLYAVWAKGVVGKFVPRN